MTTPENISELGPNQFIVVGTNLSGWHGGGLARYAADNFGLEAGVGEGFSGQCYALPTLNGSLGQMSLQLADAVQRFYATVRALPDKQFLLTRVGTGIAGYSEDFMKSLFKQDEPNLVKPSGW